MNAKYLIDRLCLVYHGHEPDLHQNSISCQQRVSEMVYLQLELPICKSLNAPRQQRTLHYAHHRGLPQTPPACDVRTHSSRYSPVWAPDSYVHWCPERSSVTWRRSGAVCDHRFWRRSSDPQPLLPRSSSPSLIAAMLQTLRSVRRLLVFRRFVCLHLRLINTGVLKVREGVAKNAQSICRSEPKTYRNGHDGRSTGQAASPGCWKPRLKPQNNVFENIASEKKTKIEQLSW